MAIKLEVEDYCHQCSDFCSETSTAQRIAGADDKHVVADTIVRCKYRKRCASLMRYLERQLKEREVPSCETE